MRTPIIIAVIVGVIVGGLGGALTDVGTWYKNLKKPWFNPPNWLFAPAWTLIYILCGVAAVQAWNATTSDSQRTMFLALWGFNAVVNVLWSYLFFTAKRPDWALMEVAVLWLSILSLVVFFATYAVPQALLLLPYLGWVTFAAFLNFSLVRMNQPFGLSG